MNPDNSVIAVNRERSEVCVLSRIRSLDGLKGLAISGVMLYHFAGDASLSGSDARVAAVLKAGLMTGWTGVELFFVIAGFLTTRTLLRMREQEDSLRQFYISRALRIMPLYYGLLFALCVVLPRSSHGVRHALQPLLDNQLWYWLFASNWLVAIHGEFLRAGYLWFIAVLVQFYLIWPWLVYSFDANRLLWFAVLIFVLSAPLRLVLISLGTDPTSLYVSTFTHLDGFAAGSVIAVLYPSKGSLERLSLSLRRASLVSITIIFISYVINGRFIFWDPWTTVVAPLLLSVISAYLLVVVISSPAESWPNRVLSRSVLASLGKLSYGLYLVHPLVGMVIATVLYGRVFAVVHVPALVLGISTAMTVSWLCALVSWQIVEMPLVRIVNR